jgi:hypothetical protein
MVFIRVHFGPCPQGGHGETAIIPDASPFPGRQAVCLDRAIAATLARHGSLLGDPSVSQETVLDIYTSKKDFAITDLHAAMQHHRERVAATCSYERAVPSKALR